MSEQEKQGMSGCAIAAIVVGIILVLGLIGVGTCTMLFMKSPAGQMMSETVSATAGASTRPGTNELRAAGCAEALVLDCSKMATFATQLAPDAGVDEAMEAMKTAVMVTCADPPATMTCANVAKIYAPHAPAEVK